MPVPPKKTKKPGKISTGHHLRPIDEETAGKIYLVRDKDYGDGQAPELWGKNLPYADACIIKETVAARGKSRTVRVEEQTPDNEYAALPVSQRSPLYRPDLTGAPTSAEPEIAAAQKAALAAARPVAAAAQLRASAPPKVVIPPAALVPPPPMPELPAELEGEGDLPALDPDELETLLEGGEVDDEEVKAANAEAGDRPAPVNLVELAVRTEACSTCRAAPGIACSDPSSGPITHPDRIRAAALNAQASQ